MNGKAGRPQKDLYPLRFGYLLPIWSERVDGKTIWHCACTGGGSGIYKEETCVSRKGRNELIAVPHTYLSSGNKRSCGCMTRRRPKERPYGVRAEPKDYEDARVDLVLKYGRMPPLAVDESPAPKGETIGTFSISDRDGVQWIVDVDDALAIEKFEDGSDEFWQATEDAINKAGRVRATN